MKPLTLSKRRLWLGALGVAVMAAVPLFVDPFTMFILVLALNYAVIGLYLNFLIGYGGIFFVAPTIFGNIAGYTSAWLSLNRGMHPFLTIPIGVAFAVVSSFMFSLLATRLRGLYMVLYSFIFLLLIGTIAIQSHPAIYPWTGGPQGWGHVPDIVVGDFSFRAAGGVGFYYLGLGLLVVAALALYKILNSRFGLAFRSLRDSETYASTLGVNSFKLKVYAFMVAALFTGVAWSFRTHFLSSIQPGPSYTGVIGGVWSPEWVLFFLTILVYGGIGTFLGPVVGAFILVTLDQNLVPLGAWRFIIISLTVVVTILLAPRGIVGRIEDFLASRGLRMAPSPPITRVLLSKASASDPLTDERPP